MHWPVAGPNGGRRRGGAAGMAGDCQPGPSESVRVGRLGRGSRRGRRPGRPGVPQSAGLRLPRPPHPSPPAVSGRSRVVARGSRLSDLDETTRIKRLGSSDSGRRFPGPRLVADRAMAPHLRGWGGERSQCPPRDSLGRPPAGQNLEPADRAGDNGLRPALCGWLAPDSRPGRRAARRSCCVAISRACARLRGVFASQGRPRASPVPFQFG